MRRPVRAPSSGCGLEGTMVETALSSAVRHIVSSDQLSRADVDRLVARAQELAESRPPLLSGRIMATLFYEPSTRTRLSFESAMLRLGGLVIGTEAARDFSSAAKGETLEDTIRVVSGYSDVIVLRHNERGAALLASSASAVPLINAGDGDGEHPTQALTDILTIATERGSIDGVRVALCGDLRHGRTVHSLVRLLALYSGVSLLLVAPASLQLDADIVEWLRAAGVSCATAADANALDDTVDVVYQTRIQRERMADLDATPADCVRIDLAVMRRLAKSAVVMHPLPRVGEIDVAVDSDPRAAYFRQAHHGVAMRMALLDWLLA